MFEWLRRLLGKKQIEKPTLVSRAISLNEQEQFQKDKREELPRRFRPPPHLEALKEGNLLHNRRRRPASQTYTGRKVRGMKPRSARNKRM